MPEPWLEALNSIGYFSLLFLIASAFFAGFIDAVVGGGGLIQLPALLIQLPQTALPVILGTNKIAALTGTSLAAQRYARHFRFNFQLLAVIGLFALIFAYIGAQMVHHFNPDVLRPLLFVILLAMALYTYFKKDLGQAKSKSLPFSSQLIYGSLLACVVGFYDGFIGPGTGSFLVLGFVVLLGFDFIQASAYAKFINVITNASALFVFVQQGNYLLELALLMSISNGAGSWIGSVTALKRGNGFVRKVFLLIVVILLIRYGTDLYTDWTLIKTK